MNSLQEKLFEARDPGYQQFQAKLIPNLASDTIIGVRTPQLRRMAKALDDPEAFRSAVPHTYFEENQIHAFSLEEEKDLEKLIDGIDSFLPFVDNWATCDQLRPKAFAKNREALLPHIRRWIASGHVYTIRFGIGMLLSHYLDGEFREEYLELVAEVRNEDHYVKMMVAWFFATALAKQYDATVPYITAYRLDSWVHNKAIQKSVESYRIPMERKVFLKRYRI